MKFSSQDADWARVSPYLGEALDLEPHERGAWLKNLGTTHPDIARVVQDMLAELEALDAERFLTGPLTLAQLDGLMPVLGNMMRKRVGVESGDWPEGSEFRSLTTESRPADLEEGAVLGIYRLVREIGSGGMSSVWLAERCDGILERKVALKLPYEGPRHAQMAERFKREREILATLTHPNIARLYDAGVSTSGRSYLAMEYVEGATLTDHCDTARLTVRERLGIFLQVLSAVEFAHSQLVLHRDLKPSNILVTDQGRVVLLDFGIAKLLAPEANMQVPLTELAARILTPDYASPEHIAGQPLGTTSDVYSLGVVLYELLTGTRPFGAKDGSRRALEEAVLTGDPSRPSQCILTDEVASARQSTPRRLTRTLSGDLDTIILKALKKTPTQRYHSVGAFAQDIGNYLQGLPVSARPDSAGYRFRRFVSRYKLPVGAAAVTLLAIIGGGAVAAWQARVAELQARVAESATRVAVRERDKAVALASRNGAMSDFMAVLISDGALTDKPMTVSEILERSEQLATTDSSDNSEDRAAILDMIAAITLNISGNVGRSTQLVDRALALVGTSRDKDLRARLTCDHSMMTAIADSRNAAAATSAINQELANPELDPGIASNCLAYLSRISRYTQDAPAVLSYSLQSLGRFQHANRQPLDEEATLLGYVGYAYYMNGENQEANRYFETAMGKYVQMGRERSMRANLLIENWAMVSISVGLPKRALEQYDRALSFLKVTSAAGPPPVTAANRADALADIGRFAQAREAYDLCLRVTRESKFVTFEVSCLLGLASVAERSGDRAAARRYLDETNSLLLPSNHRYMLIRLAIQGRLDLDVGRLEEARAKFDEVLAAKSKSPPTTAISAALGRAEVEVLAGDTGAALARSQDALKRATSLQGSFPYSLHTGLSWLMLGRALQAGGDLLQARKAYETAIEHLSNTVDADHPDLVRARQLLESNGGTTGTPSGESQGSRSSNSTGTSSPTS
jgi:serine/threonine protein kinase/tetratricopeptide (TPR) repeat protein